MASNIPAGFAEAALVFTGSLGTAPYITTIGVSLLGVDPADYQEAANGIFDAWAASMLEVQDDDLVLQRVDLAIGAGTGPSGSVSSSSQPAPATNTGTFGPIAMSAVVQKLSADFGRRGKGRSFVPGSVTEDNVNQSGRITSALAEFVSFQYNEFLVSLASASVGMATAPVILHADGSTPSPITGARTSPLVGWIRGRIF
jgi:hypothetical protein